MSNMSQQQFNAEQAKISQRYAAPKFPRYKSDILMISDKRLFLADLKGTVTYQMPLEPEKVRSDMETLRKGNQEIFAAVRDERKSGKVRRFSRQPGVRERGAVFAYDVITGAEVKKRAMGNGQEIELKVLTLNPSAKDPSFDRLTAMTYGKGKKELGRGWGLKFREEEKASEIVQFLETRSGPLKAVAAQYELDFASVEILEAEAQHISAAVSHQNDGEGSCKFLVRCLNVYFF